MNGLHPHVNDRRQFTSPIVRAPVETHSFWWAETEMETPWARNERLCLFIRQLRKDRPLGMLQDRPPITDALPGELACSHDFLDVPHMIQLARQLDERCYHAPNATRKKLGLGGLRNIMSRLDLEIGQVIAGE
jgi:hypothetical protein